jgi:hypothetical protein
MTNLPAIQKRNSESAKALFRRTGELSIYEPCNCGSHIRHNNGGNYHEIISLAHSEGEYFIKRDTTCELAIPAEWEKISEDEAINAIEQYADWLPPGTP